MTRRRSHRVTVAVCMACTAMACIAPSCASTDVTLAILPTQQPEAGAQQEAGMSTECESTSDCHSGYCEKATCDAGSGTCQPVDCTSDENPVCGCDGVTYFGDCLRKASGIAASTQGACLAGTASTCGGTMDAGCPVSAVCAPRLLGMDPEDCMTGPQPKICWVFPSQCPSSTNQWTSCLPDGPHCVDTCTALRNGGPFIRTLMCQRRDE